jgi:D-alanine-D-alanine ligase
MLANDKALSKKILDWHGVPSPAFTAFAPGTRRAKLPKSMTYPVIVKSATQHGSEGIAQASVCDTEHQLQKRVAFMHKKVGGDVIAEQFIPGRELTVSVVGNDRLEAFPVWEVWFDKLPTGHHAIATEQIKWNVDYAQGIGIRGGRVRKMSAKKQLEIQRIAKDASRALGLSGYARVDLRMDENGNCYVIEANVNADLTGIEDFAAAAAAAGYDYGQLLQRVLTRGMSSRPDWKRS